MPGCFRGNGEEARAESPADALPHPEWREPPGYLGEAVRRAKRITGSDPLKAPLKSDSQNRKP